MAAPGLTEVDFVPYIANAGGDLVVPNESGSAAQLRFWVAGDAFPRIIIDVQAHTISCGDGTGTPTAITVP